jgi:hypothetical protein
LTASSLPVALFAVLTAAIGDPAKHLRQHDRVTERDQQRLDKIRAMTDPAHPASITHWLTPPLPDRRQSPADDRLSNSAAPLSNAARARRHHLDVDSAA